MAARVIVRARYYGRCMHCDGVIAPGDNIAPRATGGWEHADCPADPPDTDPWLEWGDPGSWGDQ